MEVTVNGVQSLVWRTPWVSVVADHGSSCLEAGLNNTVCLHTLGVGFRLDLHQVSSDHICGKVNNPRVRSVCERM